jgi:hypothetical protein
MMQQPNPKQPRQTKTVQMNINKVQSQHTQLAITDTPCFCCPDNIACTPEQNLKCAKMNHWLGLPLTLAEQEELKNLGL